MMFLPKEIEEIIYDYKNQLEKEEHKKKFIIILKELEEISEIVDNFLFHLYNTNDISRYTLNKIEHIHISSYILYEIKNIKYENVSKNIKRNINNKKYS